ncbi:predicted protein [Naegleria gruberi]|uniref:Predicted protein n=1 Tax=Naegleria gruberi TaxID=5762 RepID=D2VVY0_NAEGR|nr:uncharacterized protein NAEGRDRAFT_73179 [Naegleria gruberi]EFC38979.1 predicted protein [Naegleria gruberi]|eukprot:XP_002671723.1 predicted protein [Naegleria gruberi strain NEG-M]
MTKLQHKAMLSEFSSNFNLVFGLINSNSTQKHKNLVALEFTISTKDKIKVKLDSVNGGKTEKRYKLQISYPSNLIGHFKLSISKYCLEKKQLTLFIEDFKLEESALLFIGKVEGKVYMMLVNQQWNGLSIAKLNNKLFNPFSEQLYKNILDQNSDGGMMYNPNVYLVDEPSLHFRTICDTAMGMFLPYEKTSSVGSVQKKCQCYCQKYYNVKGFNFSISIKDPNMFNAINMGMEGAYPERNKGYCFKNGVYWYRTYDYIIENLEFEECVEIQMRHMRPNYYFQKGHFYDVVYVRGKVRKARDDGEFKTCFTLTSWKRLCIVKVEKSGWVSKYSIIK